MQTILNTRVVIISVEAILFSSFIWALVWWFKDSRNVKRWELHFIKISGMLFILFHLISACLYPLPSIAVSTIGIVLLLISGLLFISSLLSFKRPPGIAFGEKLIVELNTSGPYKFIRHPFYTSYSLAWIGGTIATGCWWLIMSFIVMIFVYYKAAKEEELTWLKSKDAQKYEEYARHTGMFMININYIIKRSSQVL